MLKHMNIEKVIAERDELKVRCAAQEKDLYNLAYVLRLKGVYPYGEVIGETVDRIMGPDSGGDMSD